MVHTGGSRSQRRERFGSLKSHLLDGIWKEAVVLCGEPYKDLFSLSQQFSHGNNERPEMSNGVGAASSRNTAAEQNTKQPPSSAGASLWPGGYATSAHTCAPYHNARLWSLALAPASAHPGKGHAMRTNCLHSCHFCERLGLCRHALSL